MKKPLKHAISALMCAIVLLTGCSAPSKTSLPSELVSPPTENAYPVTLNLVSPSFFKYNDAENSVEVKDAWLEEMYLRYNVRMNIISDSPSKKGDPYGVEATMLQKNVLNGTASYTGMVEINSYAQLQKAVANQKANSLDDYVYGNPIWEALPSHLKSIFRSRHVNAIPASVTPILKMRSFTDDSLFKTQIDVTGLQSLKEYAIALKWQKGGYAISSDGLANLGDILNAFGLYIDETDNGPIAYDPGLNAYVDFLLKENAADALKYLRELYQEGVLKINFDSSTDTALSDFKNGVCASYYGEYHDYDNCTEVLTLNPAYPRSISTSVSGYFLTLDAEQPRETVNFLLEMLLASQENYLESRLGSPENYTVGSDGTVTVRKSLNSDGHYVIPATPNLVQNLPEAFLSSQADILYTSTATAGVANTRSEYQMMIERGLAEKTIAPYKIQNPKRSTYYAIQEYILKFYNICISDAITDNSKTVEQVLAQYKANMSKLGGDRILWQNGGDRSYTYDTSSTD